MYGNSRLKLIVFRPSQTKWVHIGLIVQYVADKKSKHFKEKFEVRKVHTRAEIVCRNIETKKEYDFHERDLREFIFLFEKIWRFWPWRWINKVSGYTPQIGSDQSAESMSRTRLRDFALTNTTSERLPVFFSDILMRIENQFSAIIDPLIHIIDSGKVFITS